MAQSSTFVDLSMHALIIEDSLLISMMVEEYLRELGYTSFSTADRQSLAAAMAKEQRPDLIAADDSLVEGSGIDAVGEICGETVIPTVFMLGDPEKAQEKNAVPFGYVVAKPFLFDTFKAAVDEACSRAQQVRREG